MIYKNIKKYCNIGDIKLVYYERGRGETLLLIHGNNMNSMMMKKMFNYLSKFYHVIAVDSRGHGESENGKKIYSIELYAEDMMKFCRNKSLSNIIVIGYSDGANVALAIAHKYPYIAKKMILICGNYNVDGVKWIIKMPILFAKSVVGIARKFLPNVKFMFWKIKLMVEDYGITESEMRKINTNILILTAKYDFVYRQHQLDMNRYLKNSHMYIVKGTNHFNIITSRETFKVIKAFINEE